MRNFYSIFTIISQTGNSCFWLSQCFSTGETNPDIMLFKSRGAIKTPHRLQMSNLNTKKKTNKTFYIFEIEQDKQMPKCLFIDQRDYSFHDFVYPFNRIKGIGTSLTIMDLIKSVPHHDVGSCLFFYQQGVSDSPSVKMPTMTIRCRCDRDMDVIPHHLPKHCKLCLLESLNRCRAVTNYFNYMIIFISN